MFGWCVLQNDCKLHNAKSVTLAPSIDFSWFPDLKIMGECLWCDVISSVEVVGRHWKCQKDGPQWRFLPPGCANPDLHINKDFKKGHRGLLKTTVKLMDMLLHVCMSVCCKSHCQTPQTKQWWCQHSENSVEFQMWKSWVSAYVLMWFHLWKWVEDMEMTERWTTIEISATRLCKSWLTHQQEILKKGIVDFWKPL